jgi:hypothetical protein
MAPDRIGGTVTCRVASASLMSRQFDDGRFMHHPRLAAILMCFVLSGGGAVAADIRAPSPPVAVTHDEQQPALRSYIERRAALLLIRAAFDVIAPDDVGAVLLDDARRLAATGPTVEDEQSLADDLVSEGSYFIVSLRYLIAAGGAAWPTDRPATSYAFDAEVQLQSLQAELLAAAEEGSDPLPILLAVDRIHWQTEGYPSPPQGSDRFSTRDQLADDALANITLRDAT